ncbi:MAG: DUF5711 family protein [Anaerocolumna sp.]
MAVVLEKQDLRVYEIRKKKHRRRMAIITVISLATFIIVVLTILIMVLNRRYNSYEVIKSTERKDTTSATYYPYKNGILRLSRDGVMAMNGSGVQLFNGMFQMKDPVIDEMGNYVVVYDRGSKDLQLINGSGKVVEININNPIIKAEIANQGVVAVLMDGGDENLLEFYSFEDNVNDPILQIRTLTKEDGYPIDIALSKDGRRLVTSYVALNSGTIQNKLTFQNFGETGNNYTNKLVGAQDLGQTLIGDVEFINSNTICAFGDDRFYIYSMEKLPELVHEEILEKEVQTIFYSEEYIGLSLLNNGGESKYEIDLYDLEGNKVLSFQTNLDYSKIHIADDEIIMYSGTEWYIYNLNGKQKFYYKFNEEIMDIFPGKGFNKYIIINSNSIEDVKLTEK